MAKLLFFDNDHTYTINGEEAPSVSEISRFASREVYGEVVQSTLDRAAERGTAVHKATENIDRLGDCEVDEDYAPYVQAYIQWRKDNKITKDSFEAIEKPLASEKLWYAGTLDRCAIVDGKRTIIDLKTTSTLQKVLCAITLNAYKILWEENNPSKPIEQLYILHLIKDGTYKFVKFDIDDTLFKCCLTLHNALKKKKRSKKENG